MVEGFWACGVGVYGLGEGFPAPLGLRALRVSGKLLAERVRIPYDCNLKAKSPSLKPKISKSHFVSKGQHSEL